MSDQHDSKNENPARSRIWNDSAEGATITPAGPEHSPEAMKILLEQGADAYREYLDKQK